MIRIALRDAKVADWVRRYEAHTQYASYDPTFHTWTVHVNAGKQYGEIAQVEIDDRTGKVLHAWTGPQVSWTMARGYKGWFGRKLNDTRLWLAFCAVFLVALVDWRRIWTLRTLDLVALLSFSVSLWYFERGLVFWAVPLQYPPMVYLIARLVWIGLRARPREASTGRLPPWALAALAVFLIGFRLGLNAFDATVIDVGYAGTVGADRLMRGQLPYGNFPDASGAPCGIKHSDGTSSAYRQAKQDGRCESPVANGDTYGPVNYAAYVPAVAVAGWTGRWDDLPASHGTSAIFDLACAAGMAAVGWRFGRMRMALLCALAWLAYPVHGLRAAGEHERHDRGGVRDLGLRVRGLADTPRRPARARVLDEVRAARALAALEPLPARRPGPAAGVVPARRRRPRCSGRRSPDCCSCPAASTACGCSGIARPDSSSAARRRSRSGTGTSTCPASPISAGCRRRSRPCS